MILSENNPPVFKSIVIACNQPQGCGFSQIELNLKQKLWKMSPTSAPSTRAILLNQILGRGKPVIVVTGGSGYIGSRIGEMHE